MNQLRTRGSARVVPDTMEFADGVAFYRAELVRQRDLLRHVWSWYLLPFYPGAALMVAGGVLLRPDVIDFPVLLVVIALFMSFVIVRGNAHAAALVQRQIDDLDEDPSTGPPSDLDVRAHFEHWTVWVMKSFFVAFVAGMALGRVAARQIPMLDALSPPAAAMVLVLVFTAVGAVGLALRARFGRRRRGLGD